MSAQTQCGGRGTVHSTHLEGVALNLRIFSRVPCAGTTRSVQRVMPPTQVAHITRGCAQAAKACATNAAPFSLRSAFLRAAFSSCRRASGADTNMQVTTAEVHAWCLGGLRAFVSLGAAGGAAGGASCGASKHCRYALTPARRTGRWRQPRHSNPRVASPFALLRRAILKRPKEVRAACGARTGAKRRKDASPAAAASHLYTAAQAAASSLAPRTAAARVGRTSARGSTRVAAQLTH